MSARRPLNFDVTPATWQRRTLRYLTIYLLLAMVLVAVRYKTQHIRPDLLAAQGHEAELLTERDNLEIAVQVALTPQKIQQWASSSGMVHFAESVKTARDFGPGDPGAAVNLLPNSTNTIEVQTQWK